jgi:zinc transporter ZupT
MSDSEGPGSLSFIDAVLEIPLVYEKVFATSAMLLMTLIFCYLPYVVARKWRRANWLISLLNCVAGGVVLGALLLHMVPEMIKPHDHSHCSAHGHAHAHEFPWGAFAAGISFLGLFSIDRLFLSHAHCENDEKPTKAKGKGDQNHSHSHSHAHGHCNHDHDHSHEHDHDHGHNHKHHYEASDIEALDTSRHEDCHEADVMGGCHMEGIRAAGKSPMQAYVFVLALSMHSLLEGLGMAGKNSSPDLTRFLVGLFAHKWIEAFALGVTVMSAGLSTLGSFGLIFFYTVLTPVGIVIGMAADYFVLQSQNNASSASLINVTGSASSLPYVFNGLAAGSFMFVACIEMIPPEFHKREQTTLVKFLGVCMGFFVMAAAATYHSH